MNNLLPVGACISSQVLYISGICSLTENCRKWISVTCKIILTPHHNPPRFELQKAWYSHNLNFKTLKAQKISEVYKLNSQSQRQHRVQIMIIILVKQVWNLEATHDVCWYNQRHIYATLNTKWFFFFKSIEVGTSEHKALTCGLNWVCFIFMLSDRQCVTSYVSNTICCNMKINRNNWGARFAR